MPDEGQPSPLMEPEDVGQKPESLGTTVHRKKSGRQKQRTVVLSKRYERERREREL
ncbi:unnamed protein product [Arabidopsis lyrata]|uniref:Predicted protein n=1 Tax=Arabidopsis lyrata subsp. lyrata TaxID=81972 RepID=D7KYQ1_ARALL|nr:predicted protein [Arabidopsis lyrata subsp. lyrata]CAH8256837.1 unnamed protein product [Arabidopsis lyrata]